MTYQYNAAGNMAHTVSDLTVDITQGFDGDSEILKRHEVDTIYEEGGSSYTVTSDLYQLRSTALGGKVLTEIGAQGQKFRTYVYANGALLAWQQVTYLNGSVYYQGPVWEHRDPSNASYRVTGPTTSDPDSAAELDPFNSNMGLTNPYQFPADPPLPHKPNIFYPGFGTGANNYCLVDGIERNCSEAFMLLANGLADQCPYNNCGPRVGSFSGVTFLTGNFNSNADGWSGVLPSGMNYVGDGITLDGEKIAFGDLEYGSALEVFSSAYSPDQPKENRRRRRVKTQRRPIMGNRGEQKSVTVETHGETVFTAQKDQRGGSYLSTCARSIFGTLGFGRFMNLDDIRVHMGIPGWIDKGAKAFGGVIAGAVTIGNDIYYDPASYDPSTVEGLAELGHELTHVQQYNALGHDVFVAKYIGEYIMNGFRYGRGMDLENKASHIQDLLKQSVPQRFGNDPCKAFRH